MTDPDSDPDPDRDTSPSTADEDESSIQTQAQTLEVRLKADTEEFQRSMDAAREAANEAAAANERYRETLDEVRATSIGINAEVASELDRDVDRERQKILDRIEEFLE